MIYLALLLMVPQAWIIATIGDATISALITGVFVIANSILTIFLTQRRNRRDDDYRPPPTSENGQNPTHPLRDDRGSSDPGTDSDPDPGASRDSAESP